MRKAQHFWSVNFNISELLQHFSSCPLRSGLMLNFRAKYKKLSCRRKAVRLYLSVGFSFNSTIPPAHIVQRSVFYNFYFVVRFIKSTHKNKFCSVLFGVTIDWYKRSRRLSLSTYSTVASCWQHSTLRQSSESEILVESSDFFSIPTCIQEPRLQPRYRLQSSGKEK